MTVIDKVLGRPKDTYIADGWSGEWVELVIEESHDCNDVLLRLIDECGNSARGIFGKIELALLVRKLQKRCVPKYDELYPVTIIADRYTGIYSGGRFTAWPMDEEDVPEDPEGSDDVASEFWATYSGLVGLGNTPNEAYAHLMRQMNEK